MVWHTLGCDQVHHVLLHQEEGEGGVPGQDTAGTASKVVWAQQFVHDRNADGSLATL